jgi:hypothetical protein
MKILCQFDIQDLDGWREAIRLNEENPNAEIVEIREYGRERRRSLLLVDMRRKDGE